MQYKTLGRFFAGRMRGGGIGRIGTGTGAGSGQDRLHRPAVGRRRALRQERAVGIQMAVDEINASGLEVKGKKVKLEVVSLDDKYAPAEAAINARRLVQQYKTPAVFVPHSGGIFALQAFNEQENSW
jgi:branched-chain amino acid transport system substrate-binding protein